MWIQRDVKAGVWENAERWVMAVSFFGNSKKTLPEAQRTQGIDSILDYKLKLNHFY